MEVEHAIDVEPIKKPAKRWFNWWMATDPGGYTEKDGLKRRWAHKEIFCAGIPYASKDIAESKAHELLPKKISNRAAPISSVLKYLGAYPEGERP